MNSSVNKVVATGVAGAVTTVIVWVLKAAFDVSVPIEVQGSFTTLVSMAGVYLTPNAGT